MAVEDYFDLWFDPEDYYDLSPDFIGHHHLKHYHLSYELLNSTDKAWHVIVNGKPVWLPKSQCEMGTLTIEVPAWLVVANCLFDKEDDYGGL